MPLSSPNLDNRTFDQLLREAVERAKLHCPAWTDHSPGDPGITLLELFAYLTEAMIYQLNRLPEKAYVEFLRLIGVTLHPPAAASVNLVFTLAQPTEKAVEIPRGTRVTVARANGAGSGGAEPPVFATARAVTIPLGGTEAQTTAYHCEWAEAEIAGVGTGRPGLFLQAKRPPVVARTSEELDWIVGVEAAPDEVGERIEAVGKAFRIWREVESFTNLGADRCVYVADRRAGTIAFAPAARLTQADGTLSFPASAVGEIPSAGRQIRFWYARGGGPEGNVPAGALTVLKDPIPGVAVTNPQAAAGGRASEELSNALKRGPLELHSLQRAVTADDFELLALRSGAVARAKAFTSASLWRYAAPGAVGVLLVPDLPEAERGGGQATAAALQARETEEARADIQQSLDERRPLGTVCRVNWVRYKTVRVEAKLVVRRGENPQAVRARGLERLHQLINPLPTSLQPLGWRFGQPLRRSHVDGLFLSEPGVSYIEEVSFAVDDAPAKGVGALAADAFQERTWHGGADEALFRSGNDGEGWELIRRFEGEKITVIRAHPERPGALAVATSIPDAQGGSGVYLSADGGESWVVTARTGFSVKDLAWTLRENVAVLLLATDGGLYALPMQRGATPLPVPLGAGGKELSLRAVAVSKPVRGVVSVAVAVSGAGGVLLSKQGGRENSFVSIGLQGNDPRVQNNDVRTLEIQTDGARAFLWSGVAVPGNEAGRGCLRWELRGEQDPPEGWQPFSRGWAGGSCLALAFQGARVLAATHHAGVAWLDAGSSDAVWQTPSAKSGLPILGAARDADRLFEPVKAVAASPAGDRILAAGDKGILRGTDAGGVYENCSALEFHEKVTLPPTWLFCSGEHTLEVRSDDEAQGN